MHLFALAIVTYKNDLDFFKTLANSILKFNYVGIPIVVICPAHDKEVFIPYLPEATFVAEEELVKNAPSIRGLRVGYVTQELIRLNFYKLRFAANVLFVDSDSKFIRPFDLRDFFDSNGNLYSIMTQDKDLIADPSYRSYSVPRMVDIQRIYETLGVDSSRLLQVQSNTLINCEVLRELSEIALPNLGLTQYDALQISPFEYNWYTVWLQKSELISKVPIEPLFKTYHVRNQFVAALSQGIDEAELARSYIGVIYNSNWYRDYLNETRFERLLRDVRGDDYYFRILRNVKRKIMPITSG